MKPIIGFAGNGHLMENAAAAAHIKGFKKVKFTPGKTGDSVKDLNQCHIVYICPDRPSNVSPQEMVDWVLPHLDEDIILVIHCQVEPGFTRKIKWKNVYYHVETLKVSEDTMDRALNPERIIIGSRNPKAIIPFSILLYEFLRSFNCPIIPINYESAELAKIAINLYLAAQLCTTNTLAEIAEEIGANWDDIIPALQLDKRIGKDAYLKPGNGVGKHLMRDLKTVCDIKDINTSVIKTFIEHSNYRGKSS